LSRLEKLEVLDLIINVLMEHEKKLDEIVYKLNKLVGKIEKRN